MAGANPTDAASAAPNSGTKIGNVSADDTAKTPSSANPQGATVGGTDRPTLNTPKPEDKPADAKNDPPPKVGNPPAEEDKSDVSSNKEDAAPRTVSNPQGYAVEDDSAYVFTVDDLYNRLLNSLHDYTNTPPPGLKKPDEHYRWNSLKYYADGAGGPMAVADLKNKLKEAAEIAVGYLNS